MAKTEIRCPNCGTSFVIGKKTGTPVSELNGGINFLVPETVRNENLNEDGSKTKLDCRLEALREAGIDTARLRELMENNVNIKSIFSEDDPILERLSEASFIRNPKLFRRWITAQTWRLITDKNGWTYAVRHHYDLNYIYHQTLRELVLLIKLSRKKECSRDMRFHFFTLDDLKSIFYDLMSVNRFYSETSKDHAMANIKTAHSYDYLYSLVTTYSWRFRKDDTFKPSAWLNCFKGAGAYYTLQNLIRTHGLILPKCKTMNDSLEVVELATKEIITYKPNQRRWDILMSILTKAVAERNFKLKY